MIAHKCTVFVITIVITLGYVRSETKVPKIGRTEFKKSLTKDCANAYTLTCLKLDIVSWVDKLSEEDSYNVLPGVSVVRENNSAKANTAEIVAELARDFPNDAETRLDVFLMKKIASYLNNHSLRLKLLDKADVETARAKSPLSLGGKKGGGMGLILAIGAMMKGTLGALALGGVAALAGKALMTGLMALMLSAIIGLKSLGHHGGKTTYEIVSKPIYSHTNTHSVSHEDHGHTHGGYSSYGRSFEVPLPLGLQPTYQP